MSPAASAATARASLGASLARQLVVDGVERGGGLQGMPGREPAQPIVPGDPPVPRVIGRQFPQGLGRAVKVARVDPGAGQRQPGLRRLGHVPGHPRVARDRRQQRRGALAGDLKRGEGGQVAGGGVGPVHLRNGQRRHHVGQCWPAPSARRSRRPAAQG